MAHGARASQLWRDDDDGGGECAALRRALDANASRGDAAGAGALYAGPIAKARRRSEIAEWSVARVGAHTFNSGGVHEPRPRESVARLSGHPFHSGARPRDSRESGHETDSRARATTHARSEPPNNAHARAADDTRNGATDSNGQMKLLRGVLRVARAVRSAAPELAAALDAAERDDARWEDPRSSFRALGAADRSRTVPLDSSCSCEEDTRPFVRVRPPRQSIDARFPDATRNDST